MGNQKVLFTMVGVCIITFLIIVAYSTFLPRHGAIDISGDSIYNGQLRGVTPHGYGTYESSLSGISYEGEWENGVFHGQGTLTFANGTRLEGEFKDGAPHETRLLTY